MEIRRYGCWAGMPRGVAEDITKCIKEVYPAGRSIIPSQCNRKRGHGANGLYCKQHARMQERHLTPLAPDLGWVCGKCKTHNADGVSLCGFCDTPRLSG